CAQLADAACARHALNRVDKSLAAYPEHPDTLRAQLVAAKLLNAEQKPNDASRTAAQVLIQIERLYPSRTDLMRRARQLGG
ncbi:MAG: hypothetical protein AAF552_18435, partial [Pseudomonadota bacterium]